MSLSCKLCVKINFKLVSERGKLCIINLIHCTSFFEPQCLPFTYAALPLLIYSQTCDWQRAKKAGKKFLFFCEIHMLLCLQFPSILLRKLITPLPWNSGKITSLYPNYSTGFLESMLFYVAVCMYSIWSKSKKI